jgi:hypothetical protein
MEQLEVFTRLRHQSEPAESVCLSCRILFHVHFDIILPRKPRFPKQIISVRFPYRNVVHSSQACNSSSLLFSFN